MHRAMKYDELHYETEFQKNQKMQPKLKRKM